MKNVLEWLEASVGKYPEKTVYEDTLESLTFAELYNEARSIGLAIIEKELSDKPIAVMMGRSVHTIATFLGCVYSGHAYAPVDVSQPKSRIDKILEVLDPELIISDDEYSIKTGSVKKLLFREIKDSAVSEEPDTVSARILGGYGIGSEWSESDNKLALLEERIKEIRRDMVETDPLYVIFTSGSSGKPKGVVTSHHSLMCYISAYAGMMESGSGDRLCSQSPLDYIAAIRDIYVPLLTGAYTFLCPREYFMQPDVLFKLLNDKRISCIGWSTSALCILSRLKAFRESRPEYLKKICFSGSVMPAGVLQEWQTELPEAFFVNQYGPTEATASCTFYRIDHIVADDEMIPIGRAYDNYKVFLLSDNGGKAEQGEYGEICVGGPCVTLGYYNDIILTSKSFVQNPLNSSCNEIIYRTGDIGRMREDGNLEFHGRRDRQIKHMGHRVELDEIELAAEAMPSVDEAAALYDGKKEVIWLFYSGEADTRELIVFLRERLPGFMIPRRVKGLKSLPKLANGKTDMKVLETEF